MRYLHILNLILMHFSHSFGQGYWQRSDDLSGSLPASTLAIDSEGDILVGGLDGSLNLSRDKGNTWIQASVGLLNPGSTASAAVNSEDVFFVSNRTGRIIRSLGHGLTRTEIKGGRSDASRLSATPLAHSEGGAGREILHANRAGESWALLGGAALRVDRDVSAMLFGGSENVLAGTTGGKLLFSEARGDQIYAGTLDGSIFRSVDNGANCTLDNAGIQASPVAALLSTSSHNFAGTNGGGAFRKPTDPPSWMLPLNVFSAGVDTFSLTIGGAIDASETFDRGLDQPAPPVGFTYYAFLAISELPTFLEKDVRRWAAPFQDALEWQIQVVNATGLTSSVVWDSSKLPPEDFFFLDLPSEDVHVNMRNESSVEFTENATLTISYRPEKCVTFDFDVLGGAWYNISLPVVPEDNSLEALFPAAGAAFGWDFAEQSYVAVTALEGGRAYWLLFFDVFSYQVCGLAFETYTADYQVQGWDMIGAVCETSPITADPDSSILAMFGWDPLAQSFSAVDPFSADPERGYWVLIFSVPSTITLGNDSAAATTATPPSQTELNEFLAKHGDVPPDLPPLGPSSVANDDVPKSFSLSQNYPNPFNPETKIRFDLPAKHGGGIKVRLDIYNITGQLVRTLVKGLRAPGSHEVRWDGKDAASRPAPSGMYLYRISVGDFTATKKLLLLK